MDWDHPDRERAYALPEKLKRELMEYYDYIRAGNSHPRDGVCIWLDEATHKCRHYDLRPSICREYECEWLEQGLVKRTQSE